MKFKLFLLAAFVSTVMFAQVKPKVTSAVLAYDKSDFAQAKKKIDEAEEGLKEVNYVMADEKTLSKFYYYKGQVYLGILYSTDEEVKALDAEALEKSMDGYTKVIEFEKTAKKKRWTNDAIAKLPNLTPKLAAKGSAQADAGDFEGAKKWMNKIKSPEQALVKKQHGYFNYLHGIMVSQSNMNEAEKYFKKALKLGLTMDYDVAMAKLSLAGIAMQKRRKREATTLLQEAKKLDKNKMLTEQIKMMQQQMKKI